jgi:hypothetical protein
MWHGFVRQHLAYFGTVIVHIQIFLNGPKICWGTGGKEEAKPFLPFKQWN